MILEPDSLDFLAACRAFDFWGYTRNARTLKGSLATPARLRIPIAALHVHAAALAQIAIEHGIGYITHDQLLHRQVV